MRIPNAAVALLGVVASSYAVTSAIHGTAEEVRATSIVILDPEGRVALSLTGVGPGQVRIASDTEGREPLLMKVAAGELTLTQSEAPGSFSISLNRDRSKLTLVGAAGNWDIASDTRAVWMAGKAGEHCETRIAASKDVAALEMTGRGGVAHIRAEENRGVVALMNGREDAPCEARVEVRDQSAVFGAANDAFKGVQVVDESGVGYKMYERGRIIGQVAAKDGESSVVMRYGKAMAFARSTAQLGEVGVAAEGGKQLMAAADDRTVRLMEGREIRLQETIGEGSYQELLQDNGSGVGEKREMKCGSPPLLSPLNRK